MFKPSPRRLKYPLQELDGWHEGTAEIVTDKGKVEVVAFKNDAIHGLLITHIGAGRWTITHEKSGRAFHPPDKCLEIFRHAAAFAEKHFRGLDFAGISADGTAEPPPEYVAIYEQLLQSKWAEEDLLATLLIGGG